MEVETKSELEEQNQKKNKDKSIDSINTTVNGF